MNSPGPSGPVSGCYRSLLSTVFFMSIYLMIKVAILRRPITKGFSTWRFLDDAGSCYAVSNRGERKYFADRRAMDRAIAKWRSYGYSDFQHTEPVRRGAKQLILQHAAV